MTGLKGSTSTGAAPLSEAEVRRLLHELQLHQVELSQQNEELRAARSESEDQLARRVVLFDFAPVALATVDDRGAVQELNRRARELLGPDARPGRPLADLVAAESREPLLRALAGVGARGAGGVEITLRATSGDPTPRRAEVQVCRPQEQAHDLLVAMAETTERHRSEQARLAQHRAESADREKSVFLSRMSHELRTPLNAVLGFAQALRVDPAVRASPLVAERVERIGDAGHHLLTLVDELLDLSRLEAGSLGLLAEDFDIGALLANVVAMLAPLAAERPVRLHLSGGEAAAPVHADRARTRQVLINLVGNAIKYNRPAGEVGLHVVLHPDEVTVAITDEGAGLSAEQQAGLFVPFNRVGAEQGAVPGVGLGLAISMRLVQAMNGRLEVRAAPGQGSVFTLTLPRAASLPDEPRAHAAGPARAGSAAPLTVLYVEDNPVNAQVMLALLEERPHVRVTVAPDGQAGLRQLRTQLPDLVLLDMQLPDMDGLAFLRALREDPRAAGVPCVAVSANAMPADVQAGLAAGLAGYLTKPLEPELLFALIDRTRPRPPQP